MSFELFVSAFISLFVIVDPFGTSALFISLTGKMDRGLQKKIAVKGVLIAASLLIGFSLLGEFVLEHMGISLAAFRVAGGLLLFVTAFRMIMGFYDPDQLDSEKSVYKDRSNIAVFPLAIPMLAGPGCMTAALMFTTSAHNVLDYGMVIGAIIIVQMIALASLLGAAWLGRLFGETGNSIIARVMGILLAAMAVQFVADGFNVLVKF